MSFILNKALNAAIAKIRTFTGQAILRTTKRIPNKLFYIISLSSNIAINWRSTTRAPFYTELASQKLIEIESCIAYITNSRILFRTSLTSLYLWTSKALPILNIISRFALFTIFKARTVTLNAFTIFLLITCNTIETGCFLTYIWPFNAIRNR